MSERRFVTGDIQYRQAGEDEESNVFTLTGVAPPYGERSVPIGMVPNSRDEYVPMIEVFTREAFDEVLSRSDLDVVCVTEHTNANLLGRTASGTLRLINGDAGLGYECDLGTGPFAMDTRERVIRGDLRGSSFAFVVPETGGVEYEDRGDHVLRTVSKVSRLFDIGPVANPAYPGPGLGKRSAVDCVEDYLTWQKLSKRKSVFVDACRRHKLSEIPTWRF